MCINILDMLKKEMRLFQRYKNITNLLYQILLVVYPVYILPLKKTHLVFLCDTAWLRYPLEDSEWWPVGGSLKYNTVLQLDWFCRKQGKWVEVAYVSEKAMAPYSSTLAWKIPWTEEPGRLQSMGSLRVGHD